MVYHALKDGSVTKDITGHVVKVDDAKPLYNLMKTMQSNKKNRKRKNAS